MCILRLAFRWLLNMDNFAFEYFRKKLDKIDRRIQHMAQSIEDLNAAITAIGEAVAADVAQDVKVVEAINALKAKIDALGNPDLSAQVQALATIAGSLSGDNAAVQAAIDAAVPPAA